MKYIKLFEELSSETLKKTYSKFKNKGYYERAFNVKAHSLNKLLKETIPNDIETIDETELIDIRKQLINIQDQVAYNITDLVNLINLKLQQIVKPLELTYDNIVDNHPIANDGFYVKNGDETFYGHIDYESGDDDIYHIDIDSYKNILSKHDRVVIFDLYPDNETPFWDAFDLADRRGKDYHKIQEFKIKFGFENYFIPDSKYDYRAFALIYY